MFFIVFAQIKKDKLFPFAFPDGHKFLVNIRIALQQHFHIRQIEIVHHSRLHVDHILLHAFDGRSCSCASCSGTGGHVRRVHGSEMAQAANDNNLVEVDIVADVNGIVFGKAPQLAWTDGLQFAAAVGVIDGALCQFLPQEIQFAFIEIGNDGGFGDGFVGAEIGKREVNAFLEFEVGRIYNRILLRMKQLTEKKKQQKNCSHITP